MKTHQDPTGATAFSIIVSSCSTIRDIEPEAWNRIARCNPLAAHGWLLTVEHCWLAKFEPLYFVAERAGEIVGGAVCYVMGKSVRTETLDDLLWGRLKRPATIAGASFLPALVCGPAEGYGWHIGVESSSDRRCRDQTRRCILDAMEEESDKRGLTLSFTLVLKSETSLRALLHERHYLAARNIPVAAMDIRWSSMDEYLDHMPPKRRREYRRQERRNRDAGCRLEILDDDGSSDRRFLALLSDNARRHGDKGITFNNQLLGELRTNLGNGVLRFAARKGSTISGACLVLQRGDTALAYAVGVDPELAKNDFTYFQLAYHALIEHAVQRGIRRLYYGRGMYSVKQRRGCFLDESAIFSRVSNARRPLYAAWYRTASLWNHYKLASEILPERFLDDDADGTHDASNGTVPPPNAGISPNRII